MNNKSGNLEQLNEEKVRSGQRGVLGYFIKRYRFTLILVIAIMIWGANSLLSLPREATPEVKIPFAIVSTFYSGASPLDVEELITNPLEDGIKNIERVRRITSTSAQSISTIAVEFDAEADLDRSLDNLRSAVNAVTGLPTEAETPGVFEVSFSDLPIVTISLTGNLSEAEFKLLGKTIENRLKVIPNVSRVGVSGVLDREISVIFLPGEMERTGISIMEVASALRSDNFSFPIGEIEIDKTKYNVRTEGQFATAKDLENVVIRSSPQATIYLRDIAVVEDGFSERNTLSRLSLEGQPPRPAISLQVFKKTGGNIIEIVDRAKDEVYLLQEEGVIPAGVSIDITNDFSAFIRNDLNTLGRSGIQTTIVILILFTLALSFRKAIVGALAIPLVFLMAFGFLSAIGQTLSSLTLFSLVMSLGLLVDTIIVIMEGIHDGLKRGFTPQKAAIYSLETYKWPVIAGVGTTIAAFVPMFLVSGILGEFLKVLPQTILITLGSSLFIALVVLPGIAAWIFSRMSLSFGADQKTTVLEKYVINRLVGLYRRSMGQILSSRKRKLLIFGSIFTAFVISIGVVALGVIPIQLFPNIDIDYFFVQVELPVGSVLELTDKVVSEVEVIIREVPEVQSFVSNIGSAQFSSDGISPISGVATSHTAQIVVNLKDKKERDKKSFELAGELREKLKSIEGGNITIQEGEAGPPSGAPVEVRVFGDDLGAIADTARRFKQILEGIEGVVNIRSDDRITPPDFTFTLDRERMGQYGLNAQYVGLFLRGVMSGMSATSITQLGEDVDIVIKTSESFNSPEQLENIVIISPAGQQVRLSQIARLSITPALESIRHWDQNRITNVRADIYGTNIGAVQREFMDKASGIAVPEGVSYEFGGEVEDIDQSFTELWYSMIYAIILIFLIMVLEFDSFRQPLIIIVTLPLAVIGVIFGTALFGLSFGFTTFLGIVALAGIVVNNAIILIDRVNYNLRVRKLHIKEGLLDAGEVRLKPIIMTTLTTIAGVTPLAFVDEFWRGLSIAIAFGIAFSTVLTLGIVPILYMKLQGKRWMKEKNNPTSDPLA